MQANQQQQQPPVPSTHQVPDQRFEQLMARVKASEEQNAQLRGQIDILARQNQPNAPKAEPVFKPEVDQALTEKFQALLNPVQQQFARTTGMMVDKVDKAQFDLHYVNSNYKDYVPEVEEIMQRNQLQGQWIPREEILKKLHWDKTQRKVQEPTQVQSAQPKQTYDPYTGQWTDPATGQQVAPPSTIVQQPGEVPQAAPQPVAIQTPQQMHPQPNYNPQVQAPPNAQWVPQLPNQAPPPSAPQAQPAAVTGLSLDADDRTLSAWKDKFGDVGF